MNETCRWKQESWEYDYYESECGNMHMFTDGSPTDNGYVYCPYCGKEIEMDDCRSEDFEEDEDD